MSAAELVRARIRFWGVRGTCPSPGAHTVRYGGHTSCVEVRTANGELIVLDAGTGMRALGQSIVSEIDSRPAHVFLSHRHGDHVFGMSQFAPTIAGIRDIVLACGNVSVSELRSFVSALLSPPLFPPVNGLARRLSFLDWDVVEGVQIGTDCRVRGLPARHPGEATVIVVEDELGKLLAYAPDNELGTGGSDASVTAWRDALAAALRGVPILIHDATYTDNEIAAHAGWGHSSAEEATRFAVACNAGALLLFHHHPDRSDDDIARLVMHCRELAQSLSSPLRVDAAAEGLTLEIRLRESQMESAFVN